MARTSAYQVIDAAEAERRFSLAGQIRFPYLGRADRQEIRLYEQGWHVPGDLVSDFDFEGLPYHIIVDGDLAVGGELAWTTFEHPAFLLVVGDLHARVVVLDGTPAAPELVVGGDLVVEHGVLGDLSGPRGGRLIVSGETRAPVVVAFEDFTMRFHRPPDAVVVGDPGAFTGPVEVAGFDVLDPQLLDGDEPIRTEIRDALTEGRPILHDDRTVRPDSRIREVRANDGRSPRESSRPASTTTTRSCVGGAVSCGSSRTTPHARPIDDGRGVGPAGLAPFGAEANVALRGYWALRPGSRLSRCRVAPDSG